MDWRTTLGGMEDSIDNMLARRQLEQNGLLKILGAQEDLRQNRSNEALRHEQIEDSRAYRDNLTKTREENQRTLNEQRQALVDKAKFEQSEKARILGHLQTIANDPNADPNMRRMAQMKLMDVDPAAAAQMGDQMVDVLDRSGKKIGEARKGSIMQPAPPGGGGAAGGNPFFVPIQTGQGIFAMNGRTGMLGPRLADLKPGATMTDKIAMGEASIQQMKNLEEMFNPQWVGPAMGRYNNMKQLLIDQNGDEGLATFAAQTQALKNLVIKDITGAQMSEPEAARIMSQLPSIELPPTTFLARLRMTQKNREFLLQRQKALGYGRQGPEAAPIPENSTPTEGSDKPTAPLKSGFDAGSARKRYNY